MREQLINFQKQNKKIKIGLRNGYSYTGRIISITDDILTFRDKFGLVIGILISDVISFGEVRND